MKGTKSNADPAFVPSGTVETDTTDHLSSANTKPIQVASELLVGVARARCSQAHRNTMLVPSLRWDDMPGAHHGNLWKGNPATDFFFYELALVASKGDSATARWKVVWNLVSIYVNPITPRMQARRFPRFPPHLPSYHSVSKYFPCIIEKRAYYYSSTPTHDREE